MKARIRTIAEGEAEGALKRLYDQGISRAGKVYNIIEIMSLRPAQIRASMGLYETLMFGTSELSRQEREMIATVVSRANACFY